ncbi:hypothetical protein IX336_000651 [Porphyromonas levii]|nr:hypothetical protein [Porphyromonas levii]
MLDLFSIVEPTICDEKLINFSPHISLAIFTFESSSYSNGNFPYEEEGNSLTSIGVVI